MLTVVAAKTFPLESHSATTTTATHEEENIKACVSHAIFHDIRCHAATIHVSDLSPWLPFTVHSVRLGRDGSNISRLDTTHTTAVRRFNVMLGHVLPLIEKHRDSNSGSGSNTNKRTNGSREIKTDANIHSLTLGYFWRLGDILCKKNDFSIKLLSVCVCVC